MGFKSNGINDFDIEALKREQEEKKRLAKLEEERAAAEKKRLEEEAIKQQELQKQEEQAISNDTEVVELQDTPDGLTMMGEDGNEISIDKEQNGNPVDVSTDITEDTVSESQTSDTVINDTESEDEIKSEEATLETLDNAYLDEVMKQQPEEEEPQDEVSRLLKQIYADEEAAKKAKKAKEEKEEKEKKQKGKKKKKKKSAKNNNQKAGYSHSIYGENDDDDYDDDDKGISRFSGFSIIGNSYLIGEPPWKHLSPSGPRFVIIINHGGVAAKKNGRHFICTFNGQRSDTGRITIKFKSQFIIPVQFILFTCLDFDFLSFADFHVPLVDGKRFGNHFSLFSRKIFNKQSAGLGTHRSISG